MPIVADAAVKVGADMRPFEQDLKAGGERGTRTLGEQLKGAFSKENLLKVGVAGGLALAGAVTAGLVGAAKSLIEIERLNAQTGAAIRATGGVANVTLTDVENLTEGMEALTTVERETVQEGANLLLTFKRIRNEAGEGNDIFNRATETALDLSVALGTDMSSAAMMLGKALDDPIRGVTALRRAGVALTQQQQDQVKAFVESGNVLAAQKIILEELESQVGGSAEAFANTTAGRIQRFQNDIGNMFESIIVGATKVGDFLGQEVDLWPFDEATEEIEKLKDAAEMEMPKTIEAMRSELEKGGPVVAAEAGKIAGLLPSEIQARIDDIREAAADSVVAFGDSILNNRQSAVDQVTAMIDLVETALTRAETIAALTGPDVVAALKTGLGSDDEGLRLAAQGRVSFIVTELNKLGPVGFAAGQELLRQLGYGAVHESNYGTAVPNVRNAINNIANQFPHSEPKDPRSPFRGITHWGEDMMNTIFGNLDGAGAVASMRGALAGVLAPGATPMLSGAAVGARDGLGGGGNTYNVQMLDKLQVRTVEDIGYGLKRLDDLGKLPGGRR